MNQWQPRNGNPAYILPMMNVTSLKIFWVLQFRKKDLETKQSLPGIITVILWFRGQMLFLVIRKLQNMPGEWDFIGTKAGVEEIKCLIMSDLFMRHIPIKT